MKIQILSDLHLEFSDLKDVQAPNADVVVLAGDIHTGTNAIEWIKREFTKPVVYIAGNHEFYNNIHWEVQNDLAKASLELDNFHYLNGETVEIDGVTFWGDTLWTNFEVYGDREKAKAIAQAYMNDYRMIRVDQEHKLTPEHTLEWHDYAIQYLQETISYRYENLVVVSHHGPSRKSIPENYHGEDTNPAYVSDLEDLIRDSGIKLWIHGHTHSSHDYYIHDTRVVCNPRGYDMAFYGGPENFDFNKHLVIEV